MSLKHFHFFFIGVAMTLTAGFGYWALRDFMSTRSILILILGLLSLVSAVGLTVYLFWFIRKAKTLPS